jgi:NAD(P)-dependent dehydrogenase (short-subunit alcohol dehydrogenase family)
MTHREQQSIALVTGAAQRLGREIALQLARAGWDICVHYFQSEAEAQTLAREIAGLGRRAICAGQDLTQAGAAAALLSACREQMGAPTCLVNSAAMFEYDDAASFTDAQLDQHLALNLQAPLSLMREFAKQLPSGVQGCVVNIIDQKVAALNSDFFTYTVSKLALAESTRLAAMAFAPRVRVNAVAPGVALPSKHQSQANFDRSQRLSPLGYGATPADIAQAVEYLVHARAVTGEIIVVDGGQHLLPTARDVMFEVK